MSNLVLNDRMVVDAIDHLRSRDPAFAMLIDRVGPCRMEVESEGTHFNAIGRAIIYQQLSGRAANTIYQRFIDIYQGHPPTPEQLQSTDVDALRTVGLSRQKAAYLKDLASRSLSGELAVESLHDLADDSVIEQLTSVKGIGRWTAQVFLLFRLGRPDILSELDLGIRKAVQKLHGLDNLPTYARVLEISAPWSPYRSVASWYLWRSLE